jgi:flagellar basal-body rod modification protein FlgD
MEIGQTAQGITPKANTRSTTAQAMITSDFETFLRMLTAQMENQDPLNPIESSDYAVQLATFSGVEQQVRSNQLLEALGRQLGVMGLAQLSGWVGMEARAVSPAWFDGSPVTLSLAPVSAAQEAVLVVRDQGGAVVSRMNVPVSTGLVDWAGTDANGNPLPSGHYTFELESYADGDLLNSAQAEVYSRITEARNENGQTVLVFAGGTSLPASAVTALRDGG